MAVIFAMVSLSVDLGRARLVKTELQRVADAAARAGAAGLSTSAAQARSSAISIAGENSVDGTSFTLTNSDVEVGNWTGSSFTVNGSPSNAVRVTARRTAATGNAVPTLFARVIGRTSVDVTATSVAKYTSGSGGGFVGYDSITFKNNASIRSYNSSTNTNPTSGNATSNGGLGSNGWIKGKNGNTLYGSATLGPAGEIENVSVTGSTTTLTQAIPEDTLPTWSSSTNPGGISQNYTVGSNTTLAGGSYWFTSLTINATLSFSGPATLYVNGDVNLKGGLRPTSLIPSHLQIYQYGNNEFGDSGNNNCDVVAVIAGPDVEMVFKNNFKLRGSAKVKTMEFKNNAELYYDEAGGSASGGTTIATTD